ncbi:MAG: hypothetical protein R3E31_20150 [Chloroflexota bacterium]
MRGVGGVTGLPVALPFLEGNTRIDMAAEPVVHGLCTPLGWVAPMPTMAQSLQPGDGLGAGSFR